MCNPHLNMLSKQNAASNQMRKLKSNQTINLNEIPYKAQYYKNTLIIASESGHLNLINSSPSSFQAHLNAIFDLAFSLSSLISASADSTSKKFDLNTLTCINTFKGHSHSVKSVDVNPFNPFVIASSSRDGSILVFDSRCNKAVSQIGSIHRPIDEIKFAHGSIKKIHSNTQLKTVSTVKFLPDYKNHVISTGANDGLIKIYDLRYQGIPAKQRPPIQSSKFPDNWKRPYGYTNISLDPLGNYAYVTCTNSTIYKINLNGLTILDSYTSKTLATNFFTKTSVSYTGDFIASGSQDCNIHVWNTDIHKPFMLIGHLLDVTDVVFNLDKTQLASCSDDKTVKVWEIGGVGDGYIKSEVHESVEN